MLNQIKEDFNWGLKVGGNGHNNLDDEQVVWLIEQAETVRKVDAILSCSDLNQEEQFNNIHALFYNE